MTDTRRRWIVPMAAVICCLALVRCGGESTPTSPAGKGKDGRIIVSHEVPTEAFPDAPVPVEVSVIDPEGNVMQASVPPGEEQDVTGVLKAGTVLTVDLVVHARGDRTKRLEVKINGNVRLRVVGLGPRGASGGLQVEES